MSPAEGVRRRSKGPHRRGPESATERRLPRRRRTMMTGAVVGRNSSRRRRSGRWTVPKRKTKRQTSLKAMRRKRMKGRKKSQMIRLWPGPRRRRPRPRPPTPGRHLRSGPRRATSDDTLRTMTLRRRKKKTLREKMMPKKVMKVRR